MQHNNTIGLPSGFRDILYDEAAARRKIESTFAGVFDGNGYHEIVPSGVEFLDVYARGNQSVKDLTFKFLDRDDNLLSLRADFTPAIARIVAAGALGDTMPHRLWYAGSVYRKADLHRGRFHEFRQIGAELIGKGSKEGDVEILTTALACLEAGGMHDVQLHINHAGIFRGLIGSLGLAGDGLKNIKTEIDHKDMRRVAARLERQGVDLKVREQLEVVCRCVGGREALVATSGVIHNDETREAIDTLLQISDALSKWSDRVIFDLTEIDEMEFYTGIMFAFFSPRLSSELGSGGRYDTLLQEYGRALPAVGFSFAVDGLAELL
ncbi:MAG TPA: ATP phosphoribosyltransferase regulatory subunit [Bacteroidota bacterium]|nr:ATP phosphoribosyltransferase regulatory subunit [Bacteroidota bacterium]